MTMRTQDAEYAARLAALQLPWWKRLMDVQLPYRLHVARMKLGRTLDIGCGIGRMLGALGGESVGIDHNAKAIEISRRRGFVAYTPAEFWSSPDAARAFDSLLLAHVLEHLSHADSIALLDEYVPLLRPGGRVVVFTPQELGYRSDPTHVEFMDLPRIASVLRAVGLTPAKEYSFPFPRFVGRLFKYNEFVAIGRKER